MLTSLQNPLIKQIRKLQTPKGRRDQQQFILEGTHLIEEACAVAYPLNVVCCTPNWQMQHLQLWKKINQYANRIELVDDRILTAIATTVNPDGIIATVSRLPTTPLPPSQLMVALETLQDPGNLGTIIRTAAAAGVGGLLVSRDSVDLEHPKVLRASVGAWFHLPMRVCSELGTELVEYQQQGMQVVATLPQATQTYWQGSFKKPTIILLGNEGNGLSQSLIDIADQQVKIPLYHSIESLNVGICTALMVYEVQRQRQFQ